MQNFMNKKVLVASIALLALTPIVILVIASRQQPSRVFVDRYIDGRFIPIGGLLVNPAGLQGLTRDSESDFRKFFKAICAYGNKFGQFPDDPRQLIAFTATWPEDSRVTGESFSSPDHRKSDTYNQMDEGFSYLWTYRSPRPDGTEKPLRRLTVNVTLGW